VIDHDLDGVQAIAAQPDELRENAREYAEIAREQIGGVSESVKAYAAKEPARALGIAFGLGVFARWIIMRRRESR
jgi:hypothetical protein